MKINFHICRKLNLQPYYVKKIFPYDLYRRVKASVNHYSLESYVIETDYNYSLESTPTVERPTPFDPDQYVNEYLPNEYYEPEWIEPARTTLSQSEIINTGITHTPNTRVELKIKPNAHIYSNYSVVFCSRDDDLNNDFGLNTKYNGGYGLFCIVGSDSGNRTRIMDLDYENSIYTISFSQTNVTVQTNDEASVTTTLTNISPNTGVRPLTIWNCNAGSTPISILDGCSDRIYYFKIYEGNVLVRDFRPAIQRANGVAGLYDLVEGQFYENINTASTTNFKTNLDAEIPSRLNPADRIALSNEVLYTGNNLYTLTKTETINPNP